MKDEQIVEGKNDHVIKSPIQLFYRPMIKFVSIEICVFGANVDCEF